MKSTGATYPMYPPTSWVARVPLDRVDARYVQGTLVFLALHIPLGFAIKASPWLATAHALATAFIAFVIAAEAKTPGRLIPVLAYIAASESLWRVGRAMVFSEMAKYLLAALSILALLRFGRLHRAAKMPVVYFLLLIPSIGVMPAFDREDISFNLSGPFSLAAATFFLSRVPISLRLLRRTFTALMGPTVAFAFVATFSTLTTEQIDFYRTKVASGGLGPNQASSLLGLGALVAFLYLSLLRRHRILSWVIGLLGVWFAAQAALTFSRGGLVTTVGAAAAATFFLSLDRRFRGAAALRVLLVLMVAAMLVVPVLTSITRGALKDRFTSSSLTGRDKIIEADLIVFRENPLLGVGPGQSYGYHAVTFRASSAHTEYSRLLSEHGVLGATSLLLLILMSIRWVRQQADAKSRALSAALVSWSLLYMIHAAMRMAAVSFMFALASAMLTEFIPMTPKRNATRFGTRPPS